MKYLLIFCAALAAVCRLADGGSDVAAKIPLRVMSSNIRFNSEKDLGDTSWDARKEPYVAMIRDVRPDVIGMQEPRDPQCSDLERMLPEYERFRVLPNDQITRKEAASGMILWLRDKFSLLDSGYFWLGPTPDKPCIPWDATDRYHYRMAIWVKLMDNASRKVFYFCSTHLPYDPTNRVDCFDENGDLIRNIEERTKCAELIVERMRHVTGIDATVFVVGDMNCSDDADNPTYPSIIPFLEWMQSARDEAPETDTEGTFNGFGKSRGHRIDHIFFRGATPLRYRTVTSPDYGVKYVSDHYPIMLDVEF